MKVKVELAGYDQMSEADRHEWECSPDNPANYRDSTPEQIAEAWSKSEYNPYNYPPLNTRATALKLSATELESTTMQ